MIRPTCNLATHTSRLLNAYVSACMDVTQGHNKYVYPLLLSLEVDQLIIAINICLQGCPIIATIDTP